MSLQEEIYNQLKKAIIYGELSPGEKLNELDFAKKLSVSRTPVREAFRRLQVDGYVTFVSHKGVFVTKLPPDEIRAAYNIIAILEGYAAELAAMYTSEKELKKLRQYQKELNRLAHEKKYHDYAETNYAFHRYITTLSRNKTLANTISTLRARVYTYRFISVTIPGYLEKYASEHEHIISAIEKKDALRARDCMKKHVDFVNDILVSFLKEHNHLKDL
jgi:DNA-binding GntR family transcriptional regulator